MGSIDVEGHNGSATVKGCLGSGAYPAGLVVARQTILSDSVAVVICALGAFPAIRSRKTPGTEWSRDVELKQEHKLYTPPICSWAWERPLASERPLAWAGRSDWQGWFRSWWGLNQEERLLLGAFPDGYAASSSQVSALDIKSKGAGKFRRRIRND